MSRRSTSRQYSPIYMPFIKLLYLTIGNYEHLDLQDACQVMIQRSEQSILLAICRIKS